MSDNEQAAYRFAFLVGDALIRSGAGSASTTTSLLAIFRTTRLPDVTVSVTMGDITASHQAAGDSAPSTRVHEANPGILDISLRSATNAVLEQFVLGRLGLGEGIERMEQIIANNRRMTHVMVALGFTVLGLGFSMMLGGSVVTSLSATVISAAVYGAVHLLERLHAPGFFGLTLGGLVAVLGAAASGMVFSSSQPAVCIVAALGSWLAGIAAYGAVQDVITGWYLSATGRLLEMITNTAGLVAGVALGIHVLQPLFGGSMNFVETVEADSSNWWTSIVGAVLVSLGFALSSNGRGMIIAQLGVFGGLVQLAVLGLGSSGVSSYVQILLVAVAASAVCVVLTRTLGLASNASMMVVLLPLFPGMLVYQGVLGLIFGSDGAAGSALQAAITAFCLASGAMLGQYLASEGLWAARRRQFSRDHPGEVFRKDMAYEQNASDIMVPNFSTPFTH